MKVFPKVVRVLLMFGVTSDSLTVAHVSPTKRLPDLAVPSAPRQESGCGSLVQATYRSLETSVDVDSQWEMCRNCQLIWRCVQRLDGKRVQ